MDEQIKEKDKQIKEKDKQINDLKQDFQVSYSISNKDLSQLYFFLKMSILNL